MSQSTPFADGRENYFVLGNGVDYRNPVAGPSGATATSGFGQGAGVFGGSGMGSNPSVRPGVNMQNVNMQGATMQGVNMQDANRQNVNRQAGSVPILENPSIDEGLRQFKEMNNSMARMVTNEQFQEIRRKQRLSDFSEKMHPRVREHLEWEALVHELSACWEPVLGDAFPHQVIQFERQSPTAGFAAIPKEDFPVETVLMLLENFWLVNCRFRAKLAQEFFELQAVNKCEVGDKILSFLREKDG